MAMVALPTRWMSTTLGRWPLRRHFHLHLHHHRPLAFTDVEIARYCRRRRKQTGPDNSCSAALPQHPSRRKELLISWEGKGHEPFVDKLPIHLLTTALPR